VIFVDTNVFVIALRYPRDANAERNAAFLEAIATRGDGVTAPWNLIETCGVLSFNLSPKQLKALAMHFQRRFSVRVLPDPGGPAALVPHTTAEILGITSRRLSAGDALVVAAVEALPSRPDAFVSWDADPFRGKLPVPVLRPDEPLPPVG
jgi:predicted nucleic acid-binding protein